MACVEPAVTLWLTPRPPFRLDLTAWALRRYTGNRIDLWRDGAYRRAFLIGGRRIEAEVRQHVGVKAPRLQLRLRGVGADSTLHTGARVALARLLGLDCDVTAFHALAARDPRLAPLAARYRGVKPPRYADLFEALANAIACQQVSLAAGISVLGRLAAQLDAGAGGAGPVVFPTPQTVLQTSAAELRAAGFSRQKAGYLQAAAEAIVCGALDENALAVLDDAALLRELARLPGIKRWSAQYVVLRGLGRLAVLPVDDIAAHKHLAAWLGLPARLDAAGMQALAARWYPHAGMVYFHLLLQRLDAAGQLGTACAAQASEAIA
jgi:DNA-3-methyladenine glycosylase II